MNVIFIIQYSKFSLEISKNETMTLAPKGSNGRFDLTQPKWKQDTFTGRAKHFFSVINPRNLFVSGQQIEAAKILVDEYKLGIEPKQITDKEVWEAKALYDSAFHPITGERQILIGRVSAQVPASMVVVGGMLNFHKTMPAVVFWQWANQSYLAILNYTNRSGGDSIRTSTLIKAYSFATGAALGVSLGLNSLVRTLPSLVGRFVPFTAVVAANCVNIPCMRQNELQDGISVTDQHGEELGTSKIASYHALKLTIFCRIIMAVPAMTITPLVLEYLTNIGILKRFPKMAAPLQVGLVGLSFTFATPLCCAIFPQRSAIRVTDLENELQTSLLKKDKSIEFVYFNKGL